MRLFSSLLLGLSLLTANAFAASPDVAGDNLPKQKHDYQVLHLHSHTPFTPADRSVPRAT